MILHLLVKVILAILKVLLMLITIFAITSVVQTVNKAGVMITVLIAKMDGDLKVVMLHYVKNHVVNANHATKI